MRTRAPRCKALWIFSVLVACGPLEKKPHEDFGLNRLELRVRSEDLADLNGAVINKKPVPADLKIDGQWHQGTIRYSGQGTIDDLKKSYEIGFGGNKVRARKTFRLNAQSVDPTAMHSLLGSEAFRAMGVLAPIIEPFAVYLNDEYQGLFFLMENIDDEFFANRTIPIATYYKAFLSLATFASPSANDVEATWNVRTNPAAVGDLIRLIELVNLEITPETDAELESRVDIDGYLQYLATAVYLNHFDGFVNNFIMYREPNTQAFRFVAWDFDRVYESFESNTNYLDGYLYDRSRLARRVLLNPEWRRRYFAQLDKTFETLTPGMMESMIERFADTIGRAFAADRVLSPKGAGIAEQQASIQRNVQAWLSSLYRDTARKRNKFPF